MASPLAPWLLASLLQLASLDADVAIRADAMSTSLDVTNEPTSTLTALSASPYAAVHLDVYPLRLSARYAPRFWIPDAERDTSIKDNQDVELRLETRHERPWHVAATGRLGRGWSDLLDPSRDPTRDPARTSQVPTTRAIATTEYQAGLEAGTPIGERTVVSAAGRYLTTDSSLLATQRAVTGEASLGRAVTERDNLRFGVNGSTVQTRPPGGALTHSGTASALLNWRRSLAPDLEAWVGAGAAWLYFQATEPDRLHNIRPAAELGAARAGDAHLPALSGSLRLTTFVDRYTGQMNPSVDARVAASWPRTDRIAVSTTAYATARTDGATKVGGADARVAYLLNPYVALDFGVMLRGQYERLAGRPTFLEAAAFVGITARRDNVFGTSSDPVAP